MNSDLEKLFDEARCLEDPAQREALLDSVGASRPELRALAKRLLQAATEADALFEPAAAALRCPADPARSIFPSKDGADSDASPGGRVGRYRLIAKLGEGGCGTVFVAEQEEPVRRRVALKVIKLGMDTRSVVARFEAERQALAMMDHPNIACVFDGGATASGRPFFVMELVRGVHLTEYCQAQRLPLNDCLELFVQVCRAIQHAHQKGIIHRDIKPSNILVSGDGQDGRPTTVKVIDFGIAKAIGEKLTEKTVVTALGQFMGTPAYMSPEQAMMATLDLDTRTDIYSLGVLLFELLTGETPFDLNTLLERGWDEVRRVIREQEPPRPSVRAQQLTQRGASISTRPTAPRPWSPQSLRGDFDWIVMKCLEKDRARRYETASALVADLRRFLNSEPVEARPPSTVYRTRKFLRRHWRGAAAAVALLLTVVVAAVVSTRALIREHAARARGDQRLRAALSFVDHVFTNLSPEIASLVGATRTQEKLAASGLEFVGQLRAGAGDDPDFPLILARLRLGLSRVQGNLAVANTLGDFDAALQNATEALAALRAADPTHRSDERLQLLERAEWQAAMALLGQGRYAEALGHYDEIFRILDQLERFPKFAAQARHQRMVATKNVGLLKLRLGRSREAIDHDLLPLLNTPWARSVTIHSTADDIELLSNVNGALGFAYENAGDFAAAIEPAREAVRLREELVQRNPSNALHLEYLSILHTFAGYPLVKVGRAQEGFEALTRARSVSDGLEERDPANHKFQILRIQVASRQASAWAAWCNDAPPNSDERQGRRAQAERFLAEAEAAAKRTSGPALSADTQTLLDRARANVREAQGR